MLSSRGLYSGSRGRGWSAFQWQPTLIAHDPNPPLTIDHLAVTTAAVQDTLSPTESFLKRVEKLFSDALSATEGFVKSVNRTVADTVALTENFVASRAVLITGSDTLALTESFAKSANKSVGETLAFTESFLKSAGKSISDSIGLTESLAAAHARLFGGQDSLSITEALTHFLSRAQADTVVLTESLTPLTIPSGGGSGPSSASFVGSAAPSGHAGLFAFSMTASGWWGSSTHTSGGGWIGANTL